MSTGDDGTREVLRRARTIAIVGLSDRPERDSNEIARYLLAQGYEIIPVNPNLTEVLGRTSYRALSEIPADRRIDIVDIFRRSDQVPPIVQEAIARRVPTIWMQLGVGNESAAAAARAEGIQVYQNRCIMVDHRRLRVGSIPR